jgi:homocysteine S-methyltransferase
MEDKFQEINFRAIDAAIEARDRTRNDVLVAGSLGHRLPIEVGKQEAIDSFSQDELELSFSEQAKLFQDKGCDLIILEMMYHPNRILPAFKAANKTDLPVWAGFSIRRNNHGEIVNWTKHSDYRFLDTIQILNDFNIDVSGIMHSSIDVIEDGINIIKDHYKGLIMVYPDSGEWVSPNWEFDTVIKPKDFLEEAKKWKKLGVNMIGGCCGLSVDHIKELNYLK